MIIDRRIAGDDETIKRALARADPMILRTLLYQLDGDRSAVDAPLIAMPIYGGALTMAMPDPRYVETIRTKAFEFLKKWRDEERSLPPASSPEALNELMEICAGIELSDEQRAVGVEELAIVQYPRKVELSRRPAHGASDDFHVLVIGSGGGGIAAGVYLQQAGIPYTVLTKDGGVGGTWYRNTYPDLRVDVASHYYSFTFETPYPWKHYYAPRAEIVDYLEHCAKKHGVMEHIRFHTEVLAATWNEAIAKWEVRVRKSDGNEDTLRFNAIISSVGLFNVANMPEFDGLEDFKGKMFHTSSWDHSYDYDGKRIGVIGTGCSNMQLTPKIAKTARHLTIFQRSAGWVIPLPGYRDPISAEYRWLMDNVPYYDNWYRFRLYVGLTTASPDLYIVDPEWKKPGSTNALNEKMREFLVGYVKEKVGHKPGLVEKCVPDYPVQAKRVVMDNGWFDALLRDNVELVTAGIEKITPKGVLTNDGREHELDLLVIGVGFQTNKFLFPIKITGRDGVVLEDLWSKDGARAYLGVTIPKFPNLFCLYGPNTNPKGGSIFMWEELHARYAILCIKELIENGKRSIDVRPEVHDDYNRRMDEALKTHIWMDMSQKSYYRNQYERVDVNMPWMPAEFFKWVLEPNLEEFEINY